MVSLVGRWGSEPENFATRVGRIVRADNPGLKYLVGIDPRFIQTMTSFLPRKILHGVPRPTFGG
jgi:hypothetical protein